MRLIDADMIDIKYSDPEVIEALDNAPTVKAIPLDKVKQAREKIVELDFDFGDFYDHTESIRDMILPIIDKLIAESEG